MRQTTASSDRRGSGRILRAAGRIVLCLLYLAAPAGFSATAAAQIETLKDAPLSRDLRLAPNVDILIPTVDPRLLVLTDVKVPDLSGLTVEEARKLAEGAGLNLQVNEFQETKAPRFRVAFQRPAAGSLAKRGAWVTVNTEAWVQVPSVSKWRLEDAERAIRDAKLDPNIVRRREADVLVPQVERQSPEARTWVEPGTRVDLRIAVPRPAEPDPVEPNPVVRVTVPDVIGQTVERAKETAADARLKLTPNELQGTAAPRYRVSRQTPKAGARAEAGSWIRVDTVAWTQVPDVNGKPFFEGLMAIQAAGLGAQEVGRVLGKVPEERIRSQRPAAREWVPPKTVVTFVVEEPAPIPKVPVPDIEGRTRAEAVALLDEPGLRLVEGRLLDGDDEVERIVRQDPSAGTLVEVGSSVRADIAVPIPQVRVPNIVGETVKSAAANLSAKGFSFETLGGSGAVAPTDRIVSQEPPAGTLRPLGSMVVGEIEPPPMPTRKPLVTVPDLVGLELAPARERLAALGLPLQRAEPLVETRPDDRVTAQDPAGGARVAPGTTVVVELEAVLVSVPNLIGETRGAAEKAVRDAAFQFTAAGDLETADPFTEVTSQDPVAGTQRPRDSMVTVHVAAVLAIVPDVFGRTFRIAEWLVGNAGLKIATVGDLETAGRATKAKTQTPAAGTRVPPGNLVTVEFRPVPVAVPDVTVPDVTVPDVTDLTRSAAARVLSSVGLRASARGELDALGAIVESQDPSAGKAVPRGTAVTIVLVVGVVWLWWGAAAAALLLLLLALWAARRIWVSVPPARVTVRPVADRGAQEIEVDETAGRGLTIRLRPKRDPGEQTLVVDEDDDATKELRYG